MSQTPERTAPRAVHAAWRRVRAKPTPARPPPARYASCVHTLQRHGSVQPHDLAASLGDYVVIDVRDRSQFERGHIPGSLHVPVDRLQAGLMLSDARLPVAVLAEGDADAEAAVALLVELGNDAVTIGGGAAAWRASGQCLVTNPY
jgi:rhodanese-related sulfurtransferase